MRLRFAVLALVCGCNCGKQLEGGVEVEVTFTGFTPACLEVIATDRMDMTKTGTSTKTVVESRAHYFGIAMEKSWSRKWTIEVLARESSCTGAVVASVRDDTVEVPLGPPIAKAYALSAVDQDGDGFVSRDGGGTDCDDSEMLRNPGRAETCRDGLDNDCANGADCADPVCASQLCTPSDACTVNGTCTNGACVGAPLDCGPPTLPCRADAGTCTSGTCSWPLLPTMTPCDAGSVCNASGSCVAAGSELNCADGLDDDNDDAGIDCADVDCQAQNCDAGLCVVNATCQAFACMGAPRLCLSPPLCRVAGTCDPGDGGCNYPPAPATTTCNVDACLTGQLCDGAGSCAGGAPMVCAMPSQCVAGACDAGVCLPVALDGTRCNDDAGCTSGDRCFTGVCMGNGYTCPPATDCTAAGACEGDGGCLILTLNNGGPCGDGGTCASGVCLPGDAGVDAGVDAGGFPYIVSNANPSSYPPSTTKLHIDCAMTFNSSMGAGMPGWCGSQPPAISYAVQDGGAIATVISVSSLEITDSGILRLTGDRPVIFLVHDTGQTRIAGIIDARANLLFPGAGGNRGGCGAQTGGDGGWNMNPGLARASGGGGGGFGTAGAVGGTGDGNTVPGGTAGAISPASGLAPVLGGCPGGRGGATNLNDGGWAGAGGGALQISVAGELLLVPGFVITTSGGGGGGGPLNGRSGGGGGGSGGGILLEAALLTASGGWLTANGGAGGEAGDADQAGTFGQNGSPTSATPATCPDTGVTAGGVGGPGGAGTTLPGNGQNEINGGGGGGAVGRIVLRSSPSACVRDAGISPPPVNGGGCP